MTLSAKPLNGLPTFQAAVSQVIAHFLPRTVANRPINFSRLRKSLRGDKKWTRAIARAMVWRNSSDNKNLGKQVYALNERNGKTRRNAAFPSVWHEGCSLNPFGEYEKEANSAREKKVFLVIIEEKAEFYPLQSDLPKRKEAEKDSRQFEKKGFLSYG